MNHAPRSTGPSGSAIFLKIQSGFRALHSADTELVLLVTNDLLLAANRGKTSFRPGLSLYNHQVLLHSAHYSGVLQGSILGLF